MKKSNPLWKILAIVLVLAAPVILGTVFTVVSQFFAAKWTGSALVPTLFVWGVALVYAGTDFAALKLCRPEIGWLRALAAVFALEIVLYGVFFYFVTFGGGLPAWMKLFSGALSNVFQSDFRYLFMMNTILMIWASLRVRRN